MRVYLLDGTVIERDVRIILGDYTIVRRAKVDPSRVWAIHHLVHVGEMDLPVNRRHPGVATIKVGIEVAEYGAEPDPYTVSRAREEAMMGVGK